MSNVKMALDVSRIGKLPVQEVVKDAQVRDRFIGVWNTLRKDGGEAAYERESTYVTNILRDNEYVRACVPVSVFIAFIDLAVCGLSLEPGAKAQCYLVPRGYRGTDGQWRSQAKLQVSGYGELVLRQQAGQIRYADNPVLVYAEDEFEFTDNGERKTVRYTCRLPHTSGRVVACYMAITRPDNSRDYAVMLEEDWKRLEGYSAQNNKKGGANALYRTGKDGGIDTGFLMAKCIKHAFRSYPKVRLGRGTELESQAEEQPEMDYYGMPEGEPLPVENPVAAGEGAPALPPAETGPEPEPQQAAGVQVNAGDDGAF